MPGLRVAALIIWPALASLAQSFDVVSVTPHEGPMRYPIGDVRTIGNRMETYSSAFALIAFAYNVKNDQVERSPALAATGYDVYYIQAKAPGETPPTRDEFRKMVQSLLADRFKLALHREMRETPVYELVVAKNGPKFKEASPDAQSTTHVHVNGRSYEVTMPKTNMAGFVDLLDHSAFINRHVIDKTGLTGMYEINLTYTPDIASRGGANEPGDITIFNALPSQLGLKLEPAKVAIEWLVVDHVEKPAAN